MDAPLAPIDVANHWPFLRTYLLLDHWPAADLALGALAERQVENEGEAAAFGTRFWRGSGLTAGEAGRVTQSLAELERRGVVFRYAGIGRRPHAWSFAPSIRHWRDLSWSRPARQAERVIAACSCRAPCPFVARFPGQSVLLSRGTAQFRLSEASHLRRPGLLSVDNPVDSRDKRARRATNGQPRAWEPVETRDKWAAEPSPYLSSRELTFSIEGAAQRFALLTRTIEQACSQTLYGRRPLARVAAIAERLDDAQTTRLCELLAAFPDRLFIPKAVDVAEDLSAGREVKQAGRSLRALGDHPAGVDLPDLRLPSP